MKRDPRTVAMTISLLVSVVMLAGKGTAYFLTHSVAILSDAAESLVHGVATGFAALSLWYAARPADRKHPYGHGRIAYFSAGFEGALVFAASIAVLWSGVRGFFVQPSLQNLGLGMGIAAGLALINLVLGTALVRIGRRHNTLILVANGKHVLSDTWTTAAALLGVGLVLLTGRTWLDPLVAVIIGVYIMISGIGLIRTSFGGLMDAVEPEITQRLEELLSEQAREGRISAYHELRCRLVNDVLWVDVHFLLPGDLPMATAHARVTRLEELVREAFPEQQVQVTSHMEPREHEAAHPGGHAPLGAGGDM